jgi:ribonuclease HII
MPEIRFAVAIVDVEMIDQINIRQAAWRAMALEQLSPLPEHVLVDGLRAKAIYFPQTPLVKGDARSYSIAAASVFAKVTRDRIMRELDQQFPMYGFAVHKGYPTPAHLAALEQHGPCAIHRKSFSRIRPEIQEQELNFSSESSVNG